MSTAVPNPERTYTITSLSKWSARNFEIHHNDQVFLWVNTENPVLGSLQINIQSKSATGPIIAAAMLRSMTSNCKICVGNPECVPKEQWIDVYSEKVLSKCYRLQVGPRAFLWKRTHNSTYGASAWKHDDFKLVDACNDKLVYAVFLENSKAWRDRKTVGRLDWYQRLDQQEELAAVAAILGIVEKISGSKG